MVATRLFSILTIFLSFLAVEANAQVIRAVPLSSPRPMARAMQIQQVQSQAAAIAAAIQGQEPQPVEDRDATQATLMSQLNSIQLSRLPSEILEAWATPADTSETDDGEDVDDEPLPPAPEKAFLYNDKRFEKRITKFRRDFVLGNWEEIGKFLEMLPEDNATTLYSTILTALGQSTPLDELEQLRMQQQGRGMDPRAMETQYLSYNDILEIARMAPGEIEEDRLVQLSQLVYGIIQRGDTLQDFIATLKSEIEQAEPVFTKRQVAKMLILAQQPNEAGQFLPELETAISDNDYEALNLLSTYLLSRHEKDNKVADLEQAWTVTQAILVASEAETKQREEAIKRAVDLASKVREELGKKWLTESFTGKPERGIEIISAIGSDTAKSMMQMPSDSTARLKKLQIQNDAVNAMLEAVGDEADSWKNTLNLLALSWLREAALSYEDDSSTGLTPGMQRDVYGNIFYMDGGMGIRGGRGNGGTSPISTGDLLEARPSDRWLSLIEPSLRSKFDAIFAQLYLKVGEESLAFPYIESLGAKYPELAKNLVDEFLKVWAKNHDPNSARSNTNNYMFMFGFEQRAESIPLTRSKQQRNLKELTELIPRLKSLKLGKIDQNLIADAFTRLHSSAEVYQPEAIAAVFGSLEEVDPEVIGNLAKKMRANLASLWRDAAVQKDKKTKRRKQEMEAEVVRGYEIAKKLVADSMANHESSWALVNARAALMHDENNYKAELANHNKFAIDRRAAMAEFKRAADIYVAEVPELEKNEYRTTVFENWFYATLGACDLNLIEETHFTATKQAGIIRDTLLSMPPSAAEWHMSRFANLLFNRMSNAKSTLKFRYLKTGFEVVGDNKQARKAREVFEYYNDLVTEIQLVSHIDGSDRVGHESAFGLYVDIFHTTKIERESGGFGRYLQNQNSNAYFSYNYGRPTEDYRDKFEEHVREVLSEQFEVQAVTFETPEVTSKATKKEGWRRTPYAYILLKPRGPEVDKIPSVKLDLDFLDTSGYAVLPIESESIPIDALTMTPDPRPANVTEVIQTLDERQSEEGKLILEIKATAQGLAPTVESLFGKLDFADFEIEKIDDQGVSVNKFDGDSADAAVLSDRSWLVNLKAKDGLGKRSKSFEFLALDENWNAAEMVYQRYVDADLATVTNVVELEEKYGKIAVWQIVALSLAGLAGLFLLVGLIILINRSNKKEAPSDQLAEDLTPFGIITALRDIHQNNGLKPGKKEELGKSINRLEEHYFGAASLADGAPDLKEIADSWLRP